MTDVEEMAVWADRESAAIFQWWAKHIPNKKEGGFYGEIGLDNVPKADAPVGCVLIARLLWYFSTYAVQTENTEARRLADRAWTVLSKAFVDPVNGGIYWTVLPNGHVLDSKKQAYAQAFGVYALCAYYALTGTSAALQLARSLTSVLENRFWETTSDGYVEALSADWSVLSDQRLSDKDLDCPKTMNTHLHILEAYTSAHIVESDQASGERLRRILEIMLDRFEENGHLHLFFSTDWQSKSTAVSFGHDIEASWLIWEAAEVLEDPQLLVRAKKAALDLARSCLQQGVRRDGGVAYEAHDYIVDEHGEWWGQAEGLVGFVNAWQLDGAAQWLRAAERLCRFIDKEHREVGDGEWRWYGTSSFEPSPYRAGLWKCPYHNGRAMLEVSRRLRATSTSRKLTQVQP